MANIVTTTDFNGGNTNIPNLDLVGTNLQANYIAKLEPVFLAELLGDDLYAQLVAHIGDARFIALLPYIKPAIIDYVYYFYVEDNGSTFLAGTGAAKSKKANATTESPWPLMVKAWNQMVNLNKKTHKFLHNNPTYPEYKIELPTWFYWNFVFGSVPYGYGYGRFDGENGQCLPDIYRVKNGLGL